MTFMTRIETKDVNEAMEAADHDFEVEKHRLHTETGLLIPDQVAIVNANNGAYLGTVGHGWEPVQPYTLYELAGELMDATNGTINGVFNLRGGRIIGISFNLAEREYIPGDPISLNFIMLNAFDGSHGLAGHAPTHRAACLNVCNTSNKVYNLRHTKNVLNRVEVVKNMLKYYQNEIASFDDKMKYLVSHQMSQTEAVAWFRSLFPKPTSERAETRLENQVSTFVDCLMHGRGSDIAGVRGTSYGAFQALTEFINHERTVRIHNDRDEAEVRFETIHFGSGNTLTQKGLSKLTSSFLLDASEFHID
jgi:phage/plasmid-like protein (TIGR03299 family)